MKSVFKIQRTFIQKAMNSNKKNMMNNSKSLFMSQRRGISLINIRFNSCSPRDIDINTSSSSKNSHNHWSYQQSIPSQTFQFDSTEKINNKSLEEFMKNKYDDQHYYDISNGTEIEEKLSLRHKSNSLINLFEDIEIDHIDNVLTKKIVSQGKSIENEHDGCYIDEWMLFNYHNIDINNGYDANGIVICGLSTICNEAYQIGPIILNKNKEKTL